MIVTEARPHCLHCGSGKVWRNGHSKRVQRYLCGSCGHEFTNLQVERDVVRKSVKRLDSVSDLSELRESVPFQDRAKDSPFCFGEDVCSQFPSNVSSVGKRLSRLRSCSRDARVGALQTRVKNLESSGNIQEVVANAEDATRADIKGSIVQYSFALLKQGYSQATIKGRVKRLNRLVKLGADLHDEESVKETIAKQEWSVNSKVNAVDAYDSFLRMLGKTWKPPIYRRVRQLPFIPTEAELDQLIAGCSQRVATYLQLLKETGMRSGEACGLLRWTDIDLEQRSIRITPEKNSNPRILPLSPKLKDMLDNLPKNENIVFGANADLMRRNFAKQRKRIAAKLINPRLNQITFHTFRHWKATMEYHKTRDILHVKEILGHKSLNSTMMYTQLISFNDDEYTVAVAHSEEEVVKLAEAGFEYYCEYEKNKILRKRK